jgi:nicotinate phosphoribosyltransferase
VRVDSGDPIAGGEMAIDWWRRNGQDPTKKLAIFSDGLDAEKIVSLHRRFDGRVRDSYGWGTLLTNDFRGLVTDDALAPFSLVCKAVLADGRPTVKLSDNPQQGHGSEGRDRAVQARLRRGRAGGAGGRRLTVSLASAGRRPA